MFHRPISFLGTAAAITLAAGVMAPPAHARSAAHLNRHVIVFGLDGVRWDRLQEANAPTLKSMIATGFAAPSWLYAQPMAQTSSGPGWSTILTGVWPDKHKVVNNSFTGNDLANHPDLLSRAELADPAFKTYAALDWKPIGDRIITARVDRKLVLDADRDPGGYPVGDQKVADDAAAHIKAEGPHASFVYLGNPDIAGHDHGGASAEYLTSIETADRQIGQVIAAVRSRPTFAREKWRFLVSTDHGHTNAGGHGGNTTQERESFVIGAGSGIPHTTPAVKPKIVDVAATALDHLRVARPAELDGRRLGRPGTDPFQAVAGDLGPAVDETGIPASVLGWTSTAPPGWRIDNAAMGGGGVTEWRGWSFTDDEFWTAADRGQQRENNVRARGVFAVADPDEWSDRPTAGTFDSTLASPPVRVAGKRTVNISFESHYLHFGNQRPQVLVSFDGGADQEVLRYAADAKARTEHLTVAVPTGARQMTIKWRLSEAGNDWYWAIDDPRIT